MHLTISNPSQDKRRTPKIKIKTILKKKNKFRHNFSYFFLCNTFLIFFWTMLVATPTDAEDSSQLPNHG